MVLVLLFYFYLCVCLVKAMRRVWGLLVLCAVAVAEEDENDGIIGDVVYYSGDTHTMQIVYTDPEDESIEKTLKKGERLTPKLSTYKQSNP